MIAFSILLIALGVGLWLVLDSIVLIPAVHYGIKERFKKQLRGTLDPGWNWKLPIVERIRSIHRRPRTLDARVGFTTKDGLRLEMEGPLQYKADPGVNYDEDAEKSLRGRNVFYQQSEAGIKSALLGEVEGILGALGGKYEGEDFIKMRGALSNYINERLRLTKASYEDLPQDQILIRYDEDRVDIENELSEEALSPTDRSNLEKLYGIDIVSFSIKKLDFTEETKKALEKKKQAELRAQTVVKLLETGEKIKEGFGGTSDHHRLDVADALVNDRPRQITSGSYDGLNNSLPLANLNLGNQNQ